MLMRVKRILFYLLKFCHITLFDYISNMHYKLGGISFSFILMVLKTPETDTFSDTFVKNICKYGKLHIL